jgi:hypothetical protein
MVLALNGVAIAESLGGNTNSKKDKDLVQTLIRRCSGFDIQSCWCGVSKWSCPDA